MPVNYYPNKTVEELEAILRGLQQRQTGGAVSEVFAAGVRTVRSVGLGNAAPEVEILRVLYALFRAAAAGDDAVALAKYPNPYLQRTRRTRPSYWTSGPGPLILP
jgi:hypothetical protein